MWKRSLKKKDSETAQSLMEFIVTLFAFFTVTFLYVQMAMGLGVANYLHYATYIAARAYLSGAEDEGAQKKNAESVLDIMVGEGRFKSIVNFSGEGTSPGGAFVGTGPGFRAVEPRDTAFEQGVRLPFKAKLYMMPLLRAAPRGQSNSVELESQTWLGREPTRQECDKAIQARQSLSGVKHPAIYDNGC